MLGLPGYHKKWKKISIRLVMITYYITLLCILTVGVLEGDLLGFEVGFV